MVVAAAAAAAAAGCLVSGEEVVTGVLKGYHGMQRAFVPPVVAAGVRGSTTGRSYASPQVAWWWRRVKHTRGRREALRDRGRGVEGVARHPPF